MEPSFIKSSPAQEYHDRFTDASLVIAFSRARISAKGRERVVGGSFAGTLAARRLTTLHPALDGSDFRVRATGEFGPNRAPRILKRFQSPESDLAV